MGVIIGLWGYSGSGKDYVADHIIKDFPEYKFQKVYFADHMKRVASDMLGVPLETMYSQEGKQTKIDWLDGMTIRTFLQKFGTDAVRNNIHQDFWPRALMSGLKEDDNVIIPDMRFPNERKAIDEAGGFTCGVARETLHSNWDKLCGLETHNKWDKDWACSKKFYMKKIEAMHELTGSLHFKTAIDQMTHVSETALENQSFDWHFTLEDKEKPNYGVRLSKHIFENGYIKFP